MNVSISNLRAQPSLFEDAVGGMSIHDGRRNGKRLSRRAYPNLVTSFALSDADTSPGQQQIPQQRVKGLPHSLQSDTVGGCFRVLEVQAHGIDGHIEAICDSHFRGNLPHAPRQRLVGFGLCHQPDFIAFRDPHPVLRVMDNSHSEGLGKGDHVTHAATIADLTAARNPRYDNIQLLRAKCNLQKNAKHPVDFMQSKGFLL